jgi:branched-chain amino acid transport system ATP-binding protein
LLGRANRLAGSLTLLERKRLELARALATGPRVLLLDEIAGGLTEPEVHRLVASVKRLRDGGISIVWIEHIVHALLSVVDQIVAIDFGRKLIEGDPRTVMASPQVRDVYLGAEAG